MKRDRSGDKTTEMRIRISPELKEKIRKIGEEHDIGMSAVIRKAVEVLEKQERSA